MSEIPIIQSQLVPEGTAYLIPRASLDLFSEPLRIHEPLWEPTPAGGNDRERRRALAFLERLLDDTCADLGFDPEVAWREPRRKQTADALWSRSQRAFTVDMYAAMSILDPRNVVKITVI